MPETSSRPRTDRAAAAPPLGAGRSPGTGQLTAVPPAGVVTATGVVTAAGPSGPPVPPAVTRDAEPGDHGPAGSGVDGADLVTERVHEARPGLVRLLAEADQARRRRAEATDTADGSAVCAWNHFENIPTFYNWNNRPR